MSRWSVVGRILKLLFVLVALCAPPSLPIATGVASVAEAGRRSGSVSVRGYYRKDGTYVRPHYRSAPDGNFNNNWSTKGNVNPYTGQPGTKTAPPAGQGSDVYVKGYYRSDGTYVQPHYRSAPDGDPSNNWSTDGNVNPHTGELGSRSEGPTATGLALSGPRVTRPVLALQAALLLRGYDPGPLDDILGQRTKAALHAYVRSSGLEGAGAAAILTRLSSDVGSSSPEIAATLDVLAARLRVHEEGQR